MRFLLIIFLFSFTARAQNVTASFNTTTIGENPAAAATREFGIVTPFVSMTNSKQAIQDPQQTSTVYEWQKQINIQRFAFIYAGRSRNNFVPEFYLAQDKAQISVAAPDGTEQTDNDVSLVNGILNLAYHKSDKIKLGVNIFNLKLGYEDNGVYKSTSDTIAYKSETNMTLTGLGFGSTIFIGSNFAVAGFYTKISEKSSGTSTRKVNSATDVVFTTDNDVTHEKYGVGFAYQNGTSKSEGIRIEFTMSKMNFGGPDYNNYGNDPKSYDNVQTRLAIEGTKMGFTGGLTYTRILGQYIVYRYYIDSLIGEFPYYYSAVDVIGGFLGFKSKSGSSFGGSASFYSGNSDVKFTRQNTTAKVTEYSLGLSYAYSF